LFSNWDKDVFKQADCMVPGIRITQRKKILKMKIAQKIAQKNAQEKFCAK